MTTFADWVDKKAAARFVIKGRILSELAAATGITPQTLRRYYRGAKPGHVSDAALLIREGVPRKLVLP